MRTHRKVELSYNCDTCGTKYPKPELAKECEVRPTESAIAAIGDHVRITETRECSSSNKRYTAEGVITEISPPLPPDVEYEVKWLGQDKARLRSHVLSYIVSYQCPHCKEKRELAVFAPEFTILGKAQI